MHGSRRSSTSSARSAAPATSRRLRTWASHSWAKARCATRAANVSPRAARSPRPGSSPLSSGKRGARAHQRHRRDARHAGARGARRRGALRVADVTASISIQALRGTDAVFRAELARLRPQVGQQVSAANIARLMADSPIVDDHVSDMSQVQDAYSLRCAPQVHGAARDTVEHARGVEPWSSARRSTTRSSCPTACRVERQLPRGAARLRPRLLRHRDR